MITKLASYFYAFLERSSNLTKEKEYRRKFKIHPSARLGYLPQTIFQGDIIIGENSYFNSGKIYTGKNSFVKIGKWCAIGYNVNIHAITHDPDFATGLEKDRPYIEASIEIGDNNWIGSNVFILPGVKIGNNCVIGANSVVNKNIPSNSIYGGIPAKLIREKTIDSIKFYENK
jgi:maltose O-acetyltransferase